MSDPLTIAVLEGDETGQELLEEALRVLDPELLELPLALERFDLSLESRRATRNSVVIDAAAAIRRHGLGLKAATITPEGRNDVSSPDRILREAVGCKVIVRTGQRLPGILGPVAGVHHPIAVVRMAVEGRLRRARVARAQPVGPPRRGARVPHGEAQRIDVPRRRRVQLPDGQTDGRARLRRAEVDGVADVRGPAFGGARRRRRAPSRTCRISPS